MDRYASPGDSELTQTSDLEKATSKFYLLVITLSGLCDSRNGNVSEIVPTRTRRLTGSCGLCEYKYFRMSSEPRGRETEESTSGLVTRSRMVSPSPGAGGQAGETAQCVSLPSNSS